MKLLDSFMGFQSVKLYPSMHLGYIYFTYKLSGSWKETLTPQPNPDFVNLLNDFFWLHVAFTVAYIFQLVF